MRALFKGLGIAAAAAMMTTTTAAAAGTPASSVAPASETLDGANGLHSGVDGTTIIEIGILAAIVVVLLTVVKNGNGNDRPNSP